MKKRLINDKHKSDKRTEKYRDHREKKDNREAARNYSRDDKRDYDNGHKHDYKKHEDHKRYRDPKRDYKRDNNNDYYNKDDKRYNSYDDRKPPPYTSSNYNKDRFNTSKPRYDDRKSYDERTNDDRRINKDRRGGGGGNFDDRRKDFNDRRNFDDDRKSDRRNNESDRRPPQRSNNEDRANTHRPRRSVSPTTVPRNPHSNKYSERKDDYNSKRDRKRHSKSRSRSHSVEKSTERDQTSNNNSQRGGGAAAVELLKESRPESVSQVTEKKAIPTARNFEALLSLPLSETAPKHPNVVTLPPISTATGPIATTTTTVQLPSYYNPNVINPNKYVEQMQKRKLIWGAKKVEDSASKWGHAQFSQDQDGKVASKFMRLMGIKGAAGAESSTSPNDSDKKTTSSTSPSNSTDVKSREAMFSTMEQQYEVARQVTHTMRGVGLGFGSQPRPY